MKTALVILCLLCSTALFAQTGFGGSVLTNEPQVFSMPSHPQHASQQPLLAEQTLLPSSAFTSAKGERPLWEFAPATTEAVSLGEIARMLRKERGAVKKAEKVWTN